MQSKSLLIIVTLILVVQSMSAQDFQLIERGARVKKLADGFKFTEGPAVDPQGNVYFTDQPNNRILKWNVEKEELEVFMEDAGRANGLYFDQDGNLLAAADEKNQLWKISPETRKVKVMLKNYNKKLLNGPNDLFVDSKGGIYFTDPLYERKYWQRGPMEQDGEHVYYLPPGKKKAVRVATDLEKPNGIIGTPDGKTLYVADIGAKKTYRYSIDEDGSLDDKKLFVEMGSDGMTIDHKGNIYITGKGVTVFNPAGELIGKIPIEANWTANVTFGGKERRRLFITAMDGLYALEMAVKGVY